MKIRESLEEREQQILSPYASLSMRTKGRATEEEPCDIRPCFQRDRDRILYSKAFRRLKDKTQVFLAPEGDHYRTRMTHTLEVSQDARTIARALRLNEDLVEAIAFGHDLGHTPFGHAGERALNEISPLGFKHNEQSLRIVEHLERDGRGLNLTYEVRDGILNHQTSTTPHTLEGKVVRLADKIAYIYHDMDDAVRGGIWDKGKIPESIGKVIGYTNAEWLDTFIHDIVTTSIDTDDVKMSEPVDEAFRELRAFMFQHVYTNPKAKAEEGKAMELIKTLYSHFLANPEEVSPFFRERYHNGEAAERVVLDYISSMTDRYAITKYEEIYVPKSWHIM